MSFPPGRPLLGLEEDARHYNVYMHELIDASGTRLRLDTSPRRMVSLMPSTTETVFTLRSLDRLAGISRYCIRPRDARRENQRACVARSSVAKGRGCSTFVAGP